MFSFIRKTGAVALTVATAALFCVDTSTAKERPWYRYENAYFEVYSNGKERKVRRMVRELEDFRAAVAQVLAFDIPEDAIKTRVIVPRNWGALQDIVENKSVAAFFTVIDAVPHMVVPIGATRADSAEMLRHEYIHVLQGYSPHSFPSWYLEGFAEMMSSTQVTKGGEKFTVGDVTKRGYYGGPMIAWNSLLSDNFNPHAISDRELGSNAYYQAWILTHYLTIGDQFARYPQLSRYLGRYAAGEASLEAFEAEFGKSPNEVGSWVMQNYNRKISYYQFSFEPGIQDHEFVRTDVDFDKISPTLDRLKKLWTPMR